MEHLNLCYMQNANYLSEGSQNVERNFEFFEMLTWHVFECFIQFLLSLIRLAEKLLYYIIHEQTDLS